MASGIPPWYFSSHGPIDFGYIGWTADPIDWSSSAQDTTGVLVMTRLRAAATGTIQNIDYWTTVIGGGLTSTENLIGVYDTGQTTSGVATLIGTSTDQTTNGGTLGQLTATMATGAPVSAGQDYFAAMLWVGTTIPTVACSSTRCAQGGLSGLNLRACKYSTTGLTALPTTIAAGSLAVIGTSLGMVCR
jgi:hypothetical protein